jgi:hypothetical protein
VQNCCASACRGEAAIANDCSAAVASTTYNSLDPPYTADLRKIIIDLCKKRAWRVAVCNARVHIRKNNCLGSGNKSRPRRGASFTVLSHSAARRYLSTLLQADTCQEMLIAHGRLDAF